MDFIIKNIWFILFALWGLPLGYYRSKFRKMVYQTDSWVINIKPVFLKEIKGLFGNIFPDNPTYKKFRNFYLFYLLIYTLLFIAYLVFDTDTEKKEISNSGGIVSGIESFHANGNFYSNGGEVWVKNPAIYFYLKARKPSYCVENLQII